MWPQYLVLFLNVAGWSFALAKQGQSKGKYGLFEIFIGPPLGFYILYAGGFFAPIGWAP